MSYAGITKGTTAIASAMLLGAARFGCEEALIAELTESQPEMLARFREGIPRMYDKAYRWVAEMQEISDFLEQNPPSRDIYAAVARLYKYLATAYDEKQPGPDNAVKTWIGYWDARKADEETSGRAGGAKRNPPSERRAAL